MFAMEISSGEEFYIACDNAGTPLAVFSNNGLLLKQVCVFFSFLGERKKVHFILFNVSIQMDERHMKSMCVYLCVCLCAHVLQVQYTAYGEVYFDSNPDFVLVIGFHGGLYDPLTRLLHFGNKDYDIPAGR